MRGRSFRKCFFSKPSATNTPAAFSMRPRRVESASFSSAKLTLSSGFRTLNHEDANSRRASVRLRETMAKAGQGGLEGIAAALPRGRGLPPVERWNPPFCGDIDMRIAADGTWYYQKTPIGRLPLVKLFASVLKKEGDKYFLV